MRKFYNLVLGGLVACVLSAAIDASEDVAVHMVALFNGKAMLSVNGSRAKIIKVGETFKGVKLLASNTSEATIELNGQTEVLTLNSAVTLSSTLGTKAPSGDAAVQLWSDERGFFRASGSINGQRLEFLVDTGANLVVLSSAQANRIGLDYRSGQRSFASTASGTAPMFVLEAREVSLDSITLNSITTGVIEGNYPRVPLLGMSFLERVDMNRSGNLMTLKKRF